MPMSSKFPTESTGEKIVKIGQYLAKIWTKYDSLLFFGPPCSDDTYSVFLSKSRRRGYDRFVYSYCVWTVDSLCRRVDRGIDQ